MCLGITTLVKRDLKIKEEKKRFIEKGDEIFESSKREV